MLDHRRVQVRRHDLHLLRQSARQLPRHHPGAGRDLEHTGELAAGEPAHQVRRVRMEDQRHEVALIELRHRPCETVIALWIVHNAFWKFVFGAGWLISGVSRKRGRQKISFGVETASFDQ